MGNEVESLPRRTIPQRMAGLAPWLATLAASSAGAMAFDGTERALAVGAFVASSMGALVAITQVRHAMSSMRAWMGSRESDLSTFADDRAAAVARQFEWAVEELVAVRAELRRVDELRTEAEERAAKASERARHDADEVRVVREKLAALDVAQLDELRQKLEQVEETLQQEERDRRSAERRARAAEQRVAELSRTIRQVVNTVSSGSDAGVTASPPLIFDWTLEYDGMFHSLRLRSTSDARPSRARIVDMTGRLVAECAGAGQRRHAELVMGIPPSVAAAVESADWSAFRLEVEIDEAWREGALVARAEPVVDSEIMRPRTMRLVS